MSARRLTVGGGVWGAIALGLCAADVLADGMVVAPSMYKGVPYEGSVEERSQEAILIFHTSTQPGGRDGMFFPMKMTGLQQEPFDVNLYVFYGKWINDKLSKFGYKHRGFELKYRDWDTRQCEPNAGKKYSAPELDPFLADFAGRIPTVTALMQKLHPGEQYYLTNVRARGLKPDDVRQWADDLWLFPYYTDRDFVPFDARPGGPASAAWPESVPAEKPASTSGTGAAGGFAAIEGLPVWLLLVIGGVAGLVLGGVAAAVVAGYVARRREAEE